ncbi:MAG: TetR/AcrR family transcriptional regulator, partial [Chthoniobacterales bacterium]
VHSLPFPMATLAETTTDRRQQIMQAAMVCFAKRGFHDATMLDISAEAGISVGLISRYFQNKDAVITAMTDSHRHQLNELLARARQAPSLREALEMFFTAHCCETGPQVVATFVVDLYAEAGRNPHIAQLVRSILNTMIDGLTDLIAGSPEMRAVKHELTARDLTELILATIRGTLMRDVLESPRFSIAKRRERQLKVVRHLWRLLFETEDEPTYA